MANRRFLLGTIIFRFHVKFWGTVTSNGDGKNGFKYGANFLLGWPISGVTLVSGGFK